MFRHIGMGLVALVMLEGAARSDEEPTSGALEGARVVKLDACIAAALRNNVDVRTADAEIDVSTGARDEVRGRFLPRLHVDGSLQQWTEAYNIPFALAPGQPPANFPVHDAFQWNATVSLVQPVTQLLAIYQEYKVRDLGVDVASVRLEAQRRDTAFEVVEQYYRLLQAERLTEVAVASVDELEQQLKQANSFHDNGVVSRDDVLRAELAVANAQQRLIQARAQVKVARSSLAVTMGMPSDAAIEAVPRSSDTLPAVDRTSLEEADRVAETSRVELREVDKRIDQADHDKKVAWLKLAPQVNVVGAYLHNEGSLFTQTNSAYVGATASWDAWDWGTTASGISSANAREKQAFLARTKVAEHVRLEVERAVVGVDAAAQAMSVARVSVASAEENFRLVKTRYAANAATSFDVVDAEALLTQARGQLQTALYDYLIAHAALKRAMGLAPEALARAE